jgi:hypothetical protein
MSKGDFMQNSTIKIGGSKVNLFQLGGTFLLFACAMKAIESIYLMLVTLEKLKVVSNDPTLATSLLVGGWSLGNGVVSGWDFFGNLLGPVAGILIWSGFAFLAGMVYTKTKTFFGKEEKKR